MPTNLYGPNDTYDLKESHVLPALLRKFHDAKLNHSGTVTVWGTGTPKREFLHVDDLADACYFLMQAYNDHSPINVGTGSDISIKDLAEVVRKVTGFKGRIVWDESKPDGTPRKLLDVSLIHSLGWRHRINLEEGIKTVYQSAFTNWIYS